ncbi:BMC domain-containing protein [Paenibacillus stellifer]|uniref:BMC domain-containing protein n=1 Tax=Paenibacillus stellifer TaxID=169760 RepID=UPI000A0419B4|nr:BMC domain-containing protein [Paenibacillus stellifer]
MQQALGLIEAIGFTTAVSAADAALKTADVTIEAVEKVIGVGGMLGVTIHFSGDVAAVTSAVEAGRTAAERIGKVVSAHVIPRAHSDVVTKMLSRFEVFSAEPPGQVQVQVPEPDSSTAEVKKRPPGPGRQAPPKPE